MVIAQLIMQFLPYGIKFATAIVELVHKKNPTVEDWVAALNLAQTPFDQGLQPGVLLPDKPVGTTTAVVSTTPIS